MLSLRTIALDTDGRIAPSDFCLVSRWWNARGGVAPVREMLPTCGAVVEDDGNPIGIGFLYLDATGSGVAWLAWMATAPDVLRMTAGRAIIHLIDFLSHLAKTFHYWLIFSAYNTPSLVRALNKRGFSTGDQGATQQFKTI